MIRLRAFVDLAAPMGDFCTESLLEKASILRAYYSGCTLRRLLHGESFLEKTSILRTYCA
jgi:hypothetical protein